MKDLMVNVETLGKKPGFVVFEIAAVAFDPETMEALEEFEIVIEVEDAKRYGMKVDPETWNGGRNTAG